jgi:hypothetical protein
MDIARDDDDAAADLGKAFGKTAPDALTGAGNDGHPAGE